MPGCNEGSSSLEKSGALLKMSVDCTLKPLPEAFDTAKRRLLFMEKNRMFADNYS